MSSNIVNLAIADLAIYAVLLPPATFVAWKHGRAGIVCWPILLSFFPLRFCADIYQILNRQTNEHYTTVIAMTNAGSVACLSLAIVGLVYEANKLIPTKSHSAKILLGITHLANTAGIGMATYGARPEGTGVINDMLYQIGSCIMLGVIVAVCAWAWPTRQRILAFLQSTVETTTPYAIWLVRAAVVAAPFQLVRLVYEITHAFTFQSIMSLDPFSGSFATRLILVFMTQLGVVISVVGGGWLAFYTPASVVDEVPKVHEEGNSREMAGHENAREISSVSPGGIAARDG